MAILESDVTAPFQQEQDRLKKYTGKVTGINATGQFQQDELKKSKFSEMAAARSGVQSDVNTAKSMSELMGSTGYEEDIIERGQDSLTKQSDRQLTGTFDRMGEAAQSANLKQQEQKKFGSSAKQSELELAKANAANKFRISKYQEEMDNANSGIGSAIGGILGTVVGAYVGNPELGGKMGSAAGDGFETLL